MVKKSTLRKADHFISHYSIVDSINVNILMLYHSIVLMLYYGMIGYEMGIKRKKF